MNDKKNCKKSDMISPTVSFVFDEEKSDRIDRVLSNRFEDLSREQVKGLIKKGKLKINDKKVLKPSSKIMPGDNCEFEVEVDDFSDLPVAAPVKFDIVYEDSDIILVNKPRGIVVHPAKGHKDDTLVSGLLYLNKLLSDVEKFRPGIVHRLDMGTSGLLIIAKNNKAHRNLSDQFKARLVKKTYYAVCENAPTHITGTVDVPLSKNVHNMRIVTNPDGKKSKTNFRVLSNNDEYSFIELKPLSGRTHQLRVHLKFIGCPIVGDTLYGASKSFKFSSDGFALHAGEISFIHPATEKVMSFKSELPDDIIQLKEQLKL
ncbi:RluA family pseudouridine synthase [bacterium]|nr:RluA family pseudouridine synthase [bacterium]